jgi:hypothetical protein
MGENALFLGLILEKNLKQNNKRANHSSQIRVTVSRSGGGGIDFSFTQINNNFFTETTTRVCEYTTNVSKLIISLFFFIKRPFC